MERDTPLEVVFYCTGSGREPVREWLKSLPVEERKIIKKSQKTPAEDLDLAIKRSMTLEDN